MREETAIICYVAHYIHYVTEECITWSTYQSTKNNVMSPLHTISSKRTKNWLHLFVTFKWTRFRYHSKNDLPSTILSKSTDNRAAKPEANPKMVDFHTVVERAVVETANCTKRRGISKRDESNASNHHFDQVSSTHRIPLNLGRRKPAQQQYNKRRVGRGRNLHSDYSDPSLVPGAFICTFREWPNPATSWNN